MHSKYVLEEYICKTTIIAHRIHVGHTLTFVKFQGCYCKLDTSSLLILLGSHR